MTGAPDTREILARARTDEELVFLDGFHAVKHAMRFDAQIHLVATSDAERLASLARELAPDLEERLSTEVQMIDEEDVRPLSEAPIHRTGVWGVAQRPVVSVDGVLGAASDRPIVLLDRPVHPGNVGATVRVAAAARAAAVLVLDGPDPWSAAAVRGAAGLQFALPVAAIDVLPKSDRPLVALDPEGVELSGDAIPPGAILAFGSERDGLATALRQRAALRIRIPMREGVSSLNLAVSVGVVLYAL